MAIARLAGRVARSGRPAASGEAGPGVGCSGGGLESDCVTEGFEFADVVEKVNFGRASIRRPAWLRLEAIRPLAART